MVDIRYIWHKEAKINKNGKLIIKKAGKFIDMQCCRKDDDCDHYCPLFGEPILDKPGVSLFICDNIKFRFYRLEDERTGVTYAAPFIPDDPEDDRT